MSTLVESATRHAVRADERPRERATILRGTLAAAGTFVAAVPLLVFGNATTTGILPSQYLPDWPEPLTAIPPVEVAVRAFSGAAYLHNDGVAAAGLDVRILWVVGAALVYGAGQLIQQQNPPAAA